RLASGPILRSQLMTALSHAITQDSLTSGRLPKFATPVTAVAAAVVGFALAVLLAGGNLGTAVLIAYVIFLLSMEIAARVVEGPRQAADRRARHLIVGAFLLALLPLGSV